VYMEPLRSCGGKNLQVILILPWKSTDSYGEYALVSKHRNQEVSKFSDDQRIGSSF
jgi:hypothetical protein